MIVKFIILVLFCVEASRCCLSLKPKSPKLTSGSVVVTSRNNVIYHTYTSNPLSVFEVDTHIIELPTKLVIFDAQFQIPNAKDVWEYASYLKKPIDRIIISHSHPDHWFGLDVFQNQTKICALSETIEEIKTYGQAMIDGNYQFFGDKIPKQPTIPDTKITEGKETIDGIAFIYKKIVNTESANTLIVEMPEQKIVLVGDLIFNKFHLYLGFKSFDNWIKELQRFKTEFDGYKILLGHSKLASIDAVQENIDYLNTVKTVYGRSPNFSLFKSSMIQAYPDFKGEMTMDNSKQSLYPNEP